MGQQRAAGRWPPQRTRRREQAERTLRTSKDRLQLALDAAQLGWWQYDPLRRVILVDTRLKEIFDFTADETPLDEFITRVHPDDAERVWADREAALDPGCSHVTEQVRKYDPSAVPLYVERRRLFTQGELAHRPRFVAGDRLQAPPSRDPRTARPKPACGAGRLAVDPLSASQL